MTCERTPNVGDDDYCDETNDPSDQLISFTGVLFSRSRGCTFASLCLAVQNHDRDDGVNDDDDVAPVLVRLQFPPETTMSEASTKELRSFCRRTYKIGDRLEIRHLPHERQTTTDDQQPAQVQREPEAIKYPRIVVDCPSMNQIKQRILLRESRAWKMTQCQEWQNRYHKKSEQQKSAPKQQQPRKQSQTNPHGENGDSIVKNNGHGAGLAKRLQGQYLAEFLINMIIGKLGGPKTDKGHFQSLGRSTLPSQPDEDAAWRKRAIDYLNSGSGVVDVAGGSGHVSMALGLVGIKSTLVDARERVGMLPSRDRKIWNHALKKSNGGNIEKKAAVDGDTTLSLPKMQYCHPVVPYQTYRSWFGFRPSGVDAEYRHPDQDDLPTCDENSELLCNASAIVALHPDEATADAVRIAVSKKVPFVIVPCCVFARLFPSRQVESTRQHVSTYDDLLTYLLEQDPLIQKQKLPFDGKNIALWSTF